MNETIASVQRDTAELNKLENTVQEDLSTILIAPTNLPREMDKIRKQIAYVELVQIHVHVHIHVHV